MKIKVKIIILFFIAGILPSIVFGLFFAQVSEREIEDKVLSMSDISTNQIVKAMNDRIDYLERTVSMSVQNDVVLDMIDKLPERDVVTQGLEENKIAKHFNSVAYNNNFIKSIILLSDNYEIQAYGAGIALDVPTTYIKFFKNGHFPSSPDQIPRLNEIKWILLDTGGETELCVVKNFSYFLYSKSMGTIVFILDKAVFHDYLSDDVTKMTSFILTKDHLDIDTGEKRVDIANDIMDTSISRQLDNGWEYHLNISEDYLYQDVRNMRRNILFFMVIVSIILVIMAGYFSHTISRRLDVIIQKFKRLENGDFTTVKLLEGRDEFAIIEEHYNDTVKQIQHMIEVNYIYQLEKRKAELGALQYQINPHFLFNSFEIINSMASLGRTAEVKDVTGCLGKLFRYNMSNTKDGQVYLKEELNHIENYFYICNIQLSSRLKFCINANDDTRGRRVLKFLIQPIVENSVKHGFANQTGKCLIEIDAFLEENKDRGTLTIKITDNGEGMDAQELERLVASLGTGIEHQTAKGIGIKNVSDRIHLFYGPEYGLEITSKKGAGTVFIIRLPEEESYVPFLNR